MEVVAVYSEMKIHPTNNLCWQKAALYNIKECGTYSYHKMGVT
jgi:hypothetical protein